MPPYDYVCDHCGHEFELFQSMKEPPVRDCPACHATGEVRRLIGSGAGIIFRGPATRPITSGNRPLRRREKER